MVAGTQGLELSLAASWGVTQNKKSELRAGTPSQALQCGMWEPHVTTDSCIKHLPPGLCTLHYANEYISVYTLFWCMSGLLIQRADCNDLCLQCINHGSFKFSSSWCIKIISRSQVWTSLSKILVILALCVWKTSFTCHKLPCSFKMISVAWVAAGCTFKEWAKMGKVRVVSHGNQKKEKTQLRQGGESKVKTGTCELW